MQYRKRYAGRIVQRKLKDPIIGSSVEIYMCVGGDAVTRQSWPTVPLDCSREDRAARACSEPPRIAHYPSFSFFMLIVLLYAVHDSRCRRQQVSHSKPSAALCSFSLFFTNHFRAVSFLLTFSLSPPFSPKVSLPLSSPYHLVRFLFLSTLSDFVLAVPRSAVLLKLTDDSINTVLFN